ncbi:unnamed protein product, partial [Scytosiphon promiscuus]
RGRNVPLSVFVCGPMDRFQNGWGAGCQFRCACHVRSKKRFPYRLLLLLLVLISPWCSGAVMAMAVWLEVMVSYGGVGCSGSGSGSGLGKGGGVVSWVSVCVVYGNAVEGFTGIPSPVRQVIC